MQNSSSKLNERERFDRAMAPEQFEQVIEAILAGKYSWACVLILRFAGYNPLHYIPYRTYNRIIKDNMPKQNRRSALPEEGEDIIAIEPVKASSKRFYDLSYMEDMPSKTSQKVGGGFSGLFTMMPWRNKK
ncbi:MAG: HetP family heterocyst commitment protein [Alkalinema sp. RU_4_3]|nr:HetP family heterocyst commitment protein [Alkalinema sp. RU_4_3]